MCNTFNLKKGCKDCPFKKGNSYLHLDGLKARFDQATKQDMSFHVTRQWIMMFIENTEKYRTK